MNRSARIPVLIAGVALIAYSATAWGQSTFGNAEAGEAYDMMQTDLDGDGIRERFAVEDDNLYIFVKKDGGWVRDKKVLSDIKRLFGSTQLWGVIGSCPPGEMVPYEMLVVPKKTGKTFPVVKFHNPFYRRRFDLQQNVPLFIPPPPKMIRT